MSESKFFYPIFQSLTEELIADSVELLGDFQLPLRFVQDGANATGLTGEVMLAVIGYSAPTIRGALTLLAPRSTVRCLDPGGLEITDDDDLLADLFGELSNQMLGRFKNSLLPRGVAIQLTTPTTACGTNLRFPQNHSGLASWLRFAREEHELYVRLDATFEPSFELHEPTKEAESPVMDEGEMMFF